MQTEISKPKRARKFGTPKPTNALLDKERWQEVARRLATEVEHGPGGCVLWTGYRQPNGYGWVNIGSFRMAAHRAALIISGEDVPEGMDVCHRCDVRSCVNPSHLYVGSRRQNMADCTERGRHNKPRGARHWCAKLSDADVRIIRARCNAGETQTAVAKAFTVNPATVSRIARRVWRGEVA